MTINDLDLMLAKANGVEAEKYPEFVEEEVRKDYLIPGTEIAILRKEIKHIEEALSIEPTQEFLEYFNRVEQIKTEIREALRNEKD